MDVLRRILQSAFVQSDYESLRATLIQMYGERAIQLRDEMHRTERPEGEKTRLSSGKEEGTRAAVVQGADGNSRVEQVRFTSIWNYTQVNPVHPMDAAWPC
jgi:hypothetical protein